MIGVYTFRGVTLPADLIESIDAYVKDGRPTGDFLRAVINNDLKEAVVRADDNNLARIHAIVGYLYNECPIGCWGFAGAAERWTERIRKEKQRL